MGVGIKGGIEKWERKMSTVAPAKWKKNLSPDKWKAGLDVAGASVGPTMYNEYRDAINKVTAEDFARAVKGKGEKWATRLKEALAV